jgi:hypothetical protein
MSKNPINTAAPINPTAPAAPVIPVPVVEPAAPVQSAPTAAQVVDALLAARGTDVHTAYQIHVIANLVFEITGVERDGKIYQIAPQKVYNVTKNDRAKKVARGEAERFTSNEARAIILDKLISRSGGVAASERIDKDSLKAQALAALKPKA